MFYVFAVVRENIYLRAHLWPHFASIKGNGFSVFNVSRQSHIIIYIIIYIYNLWEIPPVMSPGSEDNM